MRLIPTAAEASIKLSVIAIAAVVVQLQGFTYETIGHLYYPLLGLTLACFAGALVTGAQAWRTLHPGKRVIILRLGIAAGIATCVGVSLPYIDQAVTAQLFHRL